MTAPACRDLELDLSLHAAGALDPDASARVLAHVDGCASCRAELSASAEALLLASLPPTSSEERRALAGLPDDTLEALRRADRRRGLARRLAAGAAAMTALAAAVALVVAPATLRAPSAPGAGAEASADAVAAWESPDLDDLWDDAAIVSFEASAGNGGDHADAALAALEW